MRLPCLRRLALLIASTSLLAACQIEADTPMRAFDVKNTAQTGAPVPITATITATFASKAWCQDEGAMAISALGSADVPIRAVSCTKRGTAGGKSEGVFQLTTSLVKTAGAANPQTVLEEVLNDDLVRFAVFPHGKRKGLLSVGLFLNLAKLEAAKAELMKMPVFQEGGDTANMQLTLSIAVTNDLPEHGEVLSEQCRRRCRPGLYATRFCSFRPAAPRRLRLIQPPKPSSCSRAGSISLRWTHSRVERPAGRTSLD